MSAQAQPLLTVEEYLELDRAAETRHEYFQGHMYAMSGGSYRHARIISSIGAELNTRLRGRPCDVLSSDMRTIAGDIFAYPDVVVVCGPPSFLQGRSDILINPTMVVEVLSPSTEGYDRGLKSSQYRRVESLLEYAIVWQIAPRVEVYRRQPNGGWLLSEYIGLGSICRFESVDCEIALAEIYARVEFDAEEQARALIPPVE